jgi:hypothetical protein
VIDQRGLLIAIVAAVIEVEVVVVAIKEGGVAEVEEVVTEVNIDMNDMYCIFMHLFICISVFTNMYPLSYIVYVIKISIYMYMCTYDCF